MAPGLLIDKRTFSAILKVLVRPFQPCLIFASKATEPTYQVLHSRVSSCPLPQTLEEVGRAGQEPKA
jgi:hypothetical protein